MADYAIGDLQGCFEPLQRLLQHIHFDPDTDRLWFVGDLVNRGPDSLAVLRFIKTLPIAPRITLGNHDLHFLNTVFGPTPRPQADDTLHDLLTAPDCEELAHWLRQQPLLYHDSVLNIVMCHAGIAPMWTLPQAKALARELENGLTGPQYHEFFAAMYGNEPSGWSDALTGYARLRVICNYFTRMRFCDAEGGLVFNYKGTLKQAPGHLFPWYAVPGRCKINADIVFGHWAALQGKCPLSNIHAIDTGCLWHGKLTALRLQDRQRFSVPGLQ